jgi:SAM-dependent methyltransferase
VEWMVLCVLALVLCFGFVLLFGAPYLPVLRPQMETALDLIDLQPGQTLLELGCGDGKVLVAAAQRGLNVIGYELNPLLALLAWLRTRRYRRQVRVVCGNFWSGDWPPADGIFVFLLDRFMVRLDARISGLQRPVRLASFAFQIPGKKPEAVRNGVYLYAYK